MEVPIFPVTPKEAEEYGIENRTEANRNCPFARRLASLRQEKGLTQQKLADLLKCSKSTISLYETGDTVPDAKNIVRLCDIFGVSCDYLLCQTNYRRAEDERLTIEEMGYSEKAAQALDDLDFIQLLNHSGHIKFPFSPKESFNLICEDSRFKELMLLICEAYQFKIADARFDPKSVDEASNLEIGGCRAMLFAIGEACAPVGEMAEVYLQRASDLLKAIVRDFPTEDPKTGEEYQMFVSGNIYNPILKNKDQSRMWENNGDYSEDEDEDEAYSDDDFSDESEQDE